MLIGPDDVRSYRAICRTLNKGQQLHIQNKHTELHSLSCYIKLRELMNRLCMHTSVQLFCQVNSYSCVITVIYTDEELPLFPVDMLYYHKVEGRVKLARTIDKEEHK